MQTVITHYNFYSLFWHFLTFFNILGNSKNGNGLVLLTFENPENHQSHGIVFDLVFVLLCFLTWGGGGAGSLLKKLLGTSNTEDVPVGRCA